MMDGTPTKARRLAELDALRGLGAIGVVLFHLTTRFPEIFPQAKHVPWTFWAGEYRVFLFFALSGFAIFFSLSKLRHAGDFIVGRAQRLFPAYWAAIAISVTVEHLAGVTALQIPPQSVLVNLSMLQGYFFVTPVDGAYWTLSYELGFYACMLVLWFFGGLKRIEQMLVAWLGLYLAYFTWADMPTRFAVLTVAQFLPFFAIGMLSWRLWAGERTLRQQAPYYALVIGFVALLESWDMVLTALALTIIFLATITGSLRWIAVRPLLWFGGISYSLYLVHENVGFVLLLKASEWGISPWISLPVTLGTVTAMGYALNRLVERPAGRWIDRQWKEWKVRRAPVTVPAE